MMKQYSSLYAAALICGWAVASAASAAPVEKGSSVRQAGDSEGVNFEVYLPLRNASQLDTLIQAQQTKGSPQYHQWLTPAQFTAQFGPTPASVARAQAAIRAAGLAVSETHSRSFHVVGDAGHVGAMLQTRFNAVRTATGASRMVAQTKPVMPAALAQEGASIVAFSSLPLHHTFAIRTAAPIVNNRYSAEGPYWFDDLKQAYDYPDFTVGRAKVDGSGVRVAILMSDLLFPGDVAAAFNHEQFAANSGGVAVPSVSTVLVNGGGAVNGPGSFEASLDVQQVLGGAPGAQVTLVSIPDLSDQNILDGYTAIVDSNRFDIVNSSFGGCELQYTAAYNNGVDETSVLKTYHEIFAQGNAQGITFVASSGDSGGKLCPTANYFQQSGGAATFVAGVSSPADDPDVTAVGGGNLLTSYMAGSLNSAYVSENGFGDPEVPYDPYGLGQNVAGGTWGAGGGVSSVFGRPAYQLLANTGSKAFRTLPDVGMQVGGCPAGISASCNATDSAAVVAYGVNYGGGFYGVIGTSVSSPEFVGALALYEQFNHRQGNVNYLLYLAGAVQTASGGASAPAALQFYHRNIAGFDGLYNGNQPSTNYSYIYGNGSPDVRKLFGFFAAPAAGLPQTPTNP
ncbi:MAG TPA: protease pro-enzyme activation domain-containing protein [Caulobacteraceae bacterium]|jgi:subtilase family serine protease|nr:protease pro-enzyme activation domain-containing protein [Caulobacteraceae bacterium]